LNDQQVIFSMVRVSRTFPPTNKQVIRDISLGFFYGAKIGVLGLNGSGKSSLLRIIAGKDDGYTGEVVFRRDTLSVCWSRNRSSTQTRRCGRWSKRRYSPS
jgi:ATPase subunit of ABC transporter with duplicated ATPase domains